MKKLKLLLFVLLIDFVAVFIMIASQPDPQDCMEFVGDPVEGVIVEGKLTCWTPWEFVICSDPEDPSTCTTFFSWTEVGIEETCQYVPCSGLSCQAWQCKVNSEDPICTTSPGSN